jgi:hypothetical protein
MKCYEIDNGRVVAGFTFVKPTDGRPYVLVGHNVVYSSPFGSQQAERGKRVYLTDALANTITIAESRVMDAELVVEADNSVVLDLPRNANGVLIWQHTHLPNDRLAADMPAADNRPRVSYKSALGMLYYVDNHLFQLGSLLAGESISVGKLLQRQVPGTERTLRHPLRTPRLEDYAVPFEIVAFDGTQVTVEQCAGENDKKAA